MINIINNIAYINHQNSINRINVNLMLSNKENKNIYINKQKNNNKKRK